MTENGSAHGGPSHGTDADVERQANTEAAEAWEQQQPLGIALGRLHSGTLRNLRWNAGNREGGREDEGSVYSGRSRGSSRSGSRHGGSIYDADRSAHGRERSVHGGDRSVHGASRLGVNGSNHGGSNFGGSQPGGTNFGSKHGGSAYFEYGDARPPGYELPGQGGALQDNAGLSATSMMEQAPDGHDNAHLAAEIGKAPVKGPWRLLRYLAKQWRGGLDTAHPRPPHWWGLVVMPFGAFLSILWIAGINRYTEPDIGMRILLPTFGASAVLLFGVPESKLSQPRNFLGGQLVSAVVGCTVRNIFSRGGTQPVVSWVAGPVGVGVALLLMQLTRTVHPPGGATALLTASAEPIGRWAGWIEVPAVMIGSAGMQIIALVMNMLAPGRRYPTFWWGADNFMGGL